MYQEVYDHWNICVSLKRAVKAIDTRMLFTAVVEATSTLPVPISQLLAGLEEAHPGGNYCIQKTCPHHLLHNSHFSTTFLFMSCYEISCTLAKEELFLEFNHGFHKETSELKQVKRETLHICSSLFLS